ncbi:MFS transporter [Variovorax sp. 770b2]|uniref:MFS transporter n=1 Tax=Variovorax sp. 770b2 TaxID=1566271 RepID=UPI0008E5108E|nr:MFS transporter [Variovorax sp. 770b2]SFP26313.1 Predicted arabinose efflux permease, MFS family [Variovorax sp. 770b2]
MSGKTATTTGSTVVLLAFAAFFSGAALRVCDSLLPRLAHDFSVTPGVAGQVVIGFSVAYGLMQLVFGPLGDRYGKTRLMCIAMFGCAVGATASALAPNLALLSAARIAWGMAAAGVIPLAMAWIGDNVPYQERQATLARFLTGTLSGMTAGQLAGGLFADSVLGWRGAFFTLALGFACVASLLLMRVPHVPVAPRADGSAHPAFIAQLRAVLAVPWARVVLVSVLAEGIFLLGPMSFLPSYLHQRHGLSLSAASAVLALYAVGGLVYAFTARRIVATLGERRMALCGGLLMGASYCVLWLSPVWLFVAPLALAALALGFGTYLFHNTLQTHATQMAPAMRGTSVALFSFCLFAGQAVGVTASGWTIDHIGYPPMLVAAALATPLAGWGFAAALRRRAQASAGT